MGINCNCCGADKLIAGQVQSTGAIYFRPTDVPFLTLTSPNIRVNANMCLGCGAIQLVGEVEQARRVLGMSSELHGRQGTAE